MTDDLPQCPGCQARDSRIEQLTIELRRLDERASYEDAVRRDKRRREETVRCLGVAR